MTKQQMKKCSKCQQIKPFNEFYRDRRTKTGFRSQCILCFNQARDNAESRERNKMRMRIYRRTQISYVAKERARKHTKEYRRWHKLRSQRYRIVHQEEYRQQNRKRMQKWRANHKEEYREINRVRQRQRQARKHGNSGSFTVEEWMALCRHYGNICIACGKPEVTIDHVIPVSKGGTNNISNIQPLCHSCNSSKRDKIIDYRPYPIPWRQLRLF